MYGVRTTHQPAPSLPCSFQVPAPCALRSTLCALPSPPAPLTWEIFNSVLRNPVLRQSSSSLTFGQGSEPHSSKTILPRLLYRQLTLYLLFETLFPPLHPVELLSVLLRHSRFTSLSTTHCHHDSHSFLSFITTRPVNKAFTPSPASSCAGRF